MTDIILVEDKHDTYVIPFEPESILNLLAGRLEQGWYYDEAEDTARKIIAVGNHAAAWAFLKGRRDHEYEYVEKQTIR